MKYKAEKKPLEQLYKLIMNRAYGKTIQKPIETDYKFVSKWKKSDNEPSEYERFIQKNYNKIIPIDGSIDVHDNIILWQAVQRKTIKSRQLTESFLHLNGQVLLAVAQAS